MMIDQTSLYETFFRLRKWEIVHFDQAPNEKLTFLKCEGGQLVKNLR